MVLLDTQKAEAQTFSPNQSKLLTKPTILIVNIATRYLHKIENIKQTYGFEQLEPITEAIDETLVLIHTGSDTTWV